MKNKILKLSLLSLLILCVGCGTKQEYPTSVTIPAVQVEVQTTVESTKESTEEHIEEKPTEWNDQIKIDYEYDYSADIKADVEYIVMNAASVQEELADMEKVVEKYVVLSESAQTQMEMNIASKWLFAIWDAELNNLWSRFSDSADAETKERVLAEQRNWIAMKEEVTITAIGSREEGGSIYPLLENTFLEEITKNRAYILADELAKIRKESFELPERSDYYGVYVDNQGSNSVYSSLLIRQDMEGNDEAIISIYRIGEVTGNFTDNGNGELAFTSYDESVKGIITVNVWDGASFKVTDASADAILIVNEAFEFPLGF